MGTQQSRFPSITETARVQQQLAHVYWIGGSPCSGKSSIVERLSRTHTFQSYNCDDAFPRHSAQVTPQAQPTFYKVTHMTWDQIWMRPVPELVADELAVYDEEFEMILQDLLALPDSSPIVAEGTALMPHLVQGVLTDPRHAIWVVPTAAFQRERYPKRGAWVQEILSQCREPDRALRNWMDRDVAFARHVIREADQRGLTWLQVDGLRTIKENADIVQAHLRLPA